jgi:hypothetical protein
LIKRERVVFVSISFVELVLEFYPMESEAMEEAFEHVHAHEHKEGEGEESKIEHPHL